MRKRYFFTQVHIEPSPFNYVGLYLPTTTEKLLVMFPNYSYSNSIFFWFRVIANSEMYSGHPFCEPTVLDPLWILFFSVHEQLEMLIWRFNLWCFCYRSETVENISCSAISSPGIICFRSFLDSGGKWVETKSLWLASSFGSGIIWLFFWAIFEILGPCDRNQVGIISSIE